MSEEPSKREQMSRDTAAAYARVFLGGDDGKRVLADLRAKFGCKRLRFRRGGDAISAALIEGECRVMLEVENALEVGAPGLALAEKK